MGRRVEGQGLVFNLRVRCDNSPPTRNARRSQETEKDINAIVNNHNT